MYNSLQIASIFEDALKIEGKGNKYLEEIFTRVFSDEVEHGRDRGFSLPKVKWIHWKSNPLNFSIFLFCKHRKNIAKFFNDMVSHWLIPEKHLDIIWSFSTRFSIPNIFNEFFTICEIVVSLENAYDEGLVLHNLPFLEKEILLGASSSYHAMKIIEMKGISIHAKVAFVQERIAAFFARFPKIFDDDVYQEMQHFFSLSKESFKAAHDSIQLFRMIITLYYFRKMLEGKILAQPTKRHTIIKIKKILIYTPFGFKEVLSVFISLNFLKKHELFEESHFFSAFSFFIPKARILPNSFLVFENKEEYFQTVYVELEKENGEKFSNEELKCLQDSLSEEVQSRIEQLVPPIFMPRNEEEVMRNILTLSAQLKYLRDLPQMIVTFDKQTDTELSFTIVLMRIRMPNSSSLEEFFQSGPFAQCISIDRIKIVGKIRRKYPKEASVLRIRFAIKKFLREDGSVDLFRARLYLVREIQKIFGEVRDFNGGMISKQNENFLLLKNLMGDMGGKYSLLMQNFFHAIFPAAFSTTLDAKLLKILFCMLIASKETKESVRFSSKKADDFLFVMMKFQDPKQKLQILHQIKMLKLSSNELLSVQMQMFNMQYMGCIYLNTDQNKQRDFLETLSTSLVCNV